jgi:membrane-associated protease RseP (regulator of RpoE activity)
MQFLADSLFDVTSFFAVATALVLSHEFGHYLAARANGVRVEVFSIGFGPELMGRSGRSGTRWKLCALPLGGYIKMFGADPDPLPSPLEDDGQTASFQRKGLGRRAIIAFAGPLANFIFAVLLIAALIVVLGAPRGALSSFGAIAALPWQAVALTWHLTLTTATAVGQFVTGATPAHQLLGPIALAQMTGAFAHRGILVLMGATAILSVNLAVTNLLPIPSLDGGHLLLYLAEAIRGRPVGTQTQIYAMRIGIALVIALMVFATWNDLVHFGIVGLSQGSAAMAMPF